MRAFGAVVLGYLMMVAFVVLTFSLAYRILGVDRVFQPAVFEPSGLWIILSIILGLIGAILGGYVCAAIARNAKAPKILAIVVLALGIVFAIPVLTSDAPAVPREGEVSSSEAIRNARQPNWIALLNPVIAAVGVMWGARLRARADSEPAV